MTMGIKETIWVGITVMVVSGCQQYKSAQTSIPAEVPVKKEMLPFQELRNASDLDILIDKIGSSRFVLLGEASHGTSEFQTWRAEISKRLIKEKDFNVIVVEGDFDEFISINAGYSKKIKVINTADYFDKNTDYLPDLIHPNALGQINLCTALKKHISY